MHIIPASNTKIKDLVCPGWGGGRGERVVIFYTDFSGPKYAIVYNDQHRSPPDPLSILTDNHSLHHQDSSTNQRLGTIRLG